MNMQVLIQATRASKNPVPADASGEPVDIAVTDVVGWMTEALEPRLLTHSPAVANDGIADETPRTDVVGQAIVWELCNRDVIPLTAEQIKASWMMRGDGGMGMATSAFTVQTQSWFDAIMGDDTSERYGDIFIFKAPHWSDIITWDCQLQIGERSITLNLSIYSAKIIEVDENWNILGLIAPEWQTLTWPLYEEDLWRHWTGTAHFYKDHKLKRLSAQGVGRNKTLSWIRRSDWLNLWQYNAQTIEFSKADWEITLLMASMDEDARLSSSIWTPPVNLRNSRYVELENWTVTTNLPSPPMGRVTTFFRKWLHF